MVDTNNVFSLLPQKLLSKNGDIETSVAVDKQLVAFYFSAHWCPPCRGFTPVLAELYAIWQSQNLSFEVIFVSSDKDEKEFLDYYGEMPWLAVPKSDTDIIAALKKKFSVSGIPKLVVVDKAGNVVDADARATTMTNTDAAFSIWASK